MEPYQLRHFVAVAGTGTFTQADHRNNVTQPTLSGSSAWLESSVGAHVFIRWERFTTMTRAGRHLYRQGLDILRSRNQVLAEIEAHPRSAA